MFRTSLVLHQERFVQAVFEDLVCGNTRTTRHVQPLQDDIRSLQYQVNTVGTLCECERWCLTRMEEHILKAFQNTYVYLENVWTCRRTVTVTWRK